MYIFVFRIQRYVTCYMLLFKILGPPLWGWGYGEGGYSKNIFPEVPPKSDKHPHKRQFSIYYSFTVINVVTFEMNTLYTSTNICKLKICEFDLFWVRMKILKGDALRPFKCLHVIYME